MIHFDIEQRCRRQFTSIVFHLSLSHRVFALFHKKSYRAFNDNLNEDKFEVDIYSKLSVVFTLSWSVAQVSFLMSSLSHSQML